MNIVGKIAKQTDETIRSAGARYTPSLDDNAPNLEIEESLNVLHALGITPAYRTRLNAFSDTVLESIPKNSAEYKKAFASTKQTPTYVAWLLRKLANEKPGRSSVTLGKISRSVSFCQKKLGRIYNVLDEIDRNKKSSSQSSSYEKHGVRKTLDTLSEVADFVGSKAYRAISTKSLLLLGEWGTGKTHFLCDLAVNNNSRAVPTLITLAHRLPTTTSPLLALCKVTGIARTEKSLLKKLDAVGRKNRCRTLLIIDGINESDRKYWRKHVGKLEKTLSDYPNIALVLSCRTPFEDQIFTSFSSFITYFHRGFEEVEIDAQHEYFSYYKIPTPHVPILTAEFSRPLFLKTICETLAELSDQTKKRRINEIASGHKGMTKILEDFVKKAARPIEEKYGLPGKACWRLLKGDRDRTTKNLCGIAPTMARQSTEILSLDEVNSIIKSVTGIVDDTTVTNFLSDLVHNGLLAEEMIWDDGQWATKIRLPYQRFSDHLISRFLLEQYLDTSSVAALKRCFYKNKPLGKVFQLTEYGHRYASPGVASAIMLEFPERIKRIAPEADRELIFYLPKRLQLFAPLVEVFLSGLLWRSADAICTQTYNLINQLLERGNAQTINETLEVLLCLATRPAHAELASRFDDYLANMPMPERDVVWSEFVRKSYSSATTIRLLNWVERHRQNSMNEESALFLIRCLKWLLTTTNHQVRDRATRALVYIGDYHLKALFEEAVKSLSVNDPYVSERMLAACYGVVMRRESNFTPNQKAILSTFVGNLYDKMFARRAQYRTKHVLARDYAAGIVRIALQYVPRCLDGREVELIEPPYTSFRGPIPAASTIEDLDCSEADNAIHMDFENYTIGRLVTNRSNYDYEHSDYKKVKQQIKWRMLNLGYSKARFENLDRNISENSFYTGGHNDGQKVDRYGKKYSWIAYFEVWGLRNDKAFKDLSFDELRPSDVDIDPSFPSKPKTWNPNLNDVFSGAPTSVAGWVVSGPDPNYNHLLNLAKIDESGGPWVLLNGWINERAPKDKRQVFAFLRGILIPKTEKRRLRSKVKNSSYPGNTRIADSPSDYYTYAGEIGRSPAFGRHLREKDNLRAKRNIENIYSCSRHRKVRKKVEELSPFEMFRVDTPIPDGAKFVEVTEYEYVPGLDVELPEWTYAWENYHSITNDVTFARIPAPALCEELQMKSANGEWDLIDSSGAKGSVFRITDGDNPYEKGWALYLRRDLLQKYLLRHNLELAWIIWGEREFHHSVTENYRHILQPIYAVHKNIHKRIKIGRFNTN